jgi:hypothetical protein
LKVDLIDDRITRYPGTVCSVSEGKISLLLRDKAKPIFHNEGEVAYALHNKSNKEVNAIGSQGIISKVGTS